MAIKQALLGIGLVFFASCTNEPRNGPSAVIDSSFAISENQTAKKDEDKLKLSLRKDSIGKEFLFQGSLVQLLPVPMFNGLKSRIVEFRYEGDSLFMFDSANGKSANAEFKQPLILAEFPITDVDADSIYFDFNTGMSKLFLGSDWKASDFEEKDDTWINAEVESSYIENAYFDGTNRLVLQQVAQIRDSKSTVQPCKMVYYLTPYQPDTQFVPTESFGFDRVGFFEVAPRTNLATNRVEILATKFNITKPIVYGISANTPAEYRDAVRDGILYWNKAFGREVIRVVDLPEGVQAPDYFNNVVQWVNWSDAGFAYADAQMDPRTGEINHAQVFLTSAFAIGGKDDLLKMLRKIHADHETPTKSHVHLKGLSQDHLCNFDFSQMLNKELMEIVMDPDVDEKMLLKISQDVIRDVVAHEIGHTLGLRHNFAGSEAMNYHLRERSSIYKDYLEKGKTPDSIATTSSVMDYMLFVESSMTGDIIRRGSQALPYDLIAIQTLYNFKEFKNEEIPLFCTDSHVSKYFECERFDIGSNYAEYVDFEFHNTLATLPNQLMEGYIIAKVLEKTEKVNIKMATPNPSQVADLLTKSRKMTQAAMNQNKKVLKIRRQYDYISPTDEMFIKENEKKYLNSAFGKFGGMETFLKPITSEQIQEMRVRFLELIDNPDYASGLTVFSSYQFSEEDKDVMREQGNRLFDLLGYYLLHSELTGFSLSVNEQSGVFQGLMLNRLREILLDITSYRTMLFSDDDQNIVFSVPQFRYNVSARKMAFDILNNGTDAIWKAQAKEILDQYDFLLNKTMQMPFEDEGVVRVMLRSDTEIARWYKENYIIRN